MTDPRETTFEDDRSRARTRRGLGWGGVSVMNGVVRAKGGRTLAGVVLCLVLSLSSESYEASRRPFSVRLTLRRSAFEKKGEKAWKKPSQLQIIKKPGRHDNVMSLRCFPQPVRPPPSRDTRLGARFRLPRDRIFRRLRRRDDAPRVSLTSRSSSALPR